MMKSFLLLFFSSLFIYANAQQQAPSNEDVRKELKLAFAIQNALMARDGDVMLAGDYVYDPNGNVIGQRYIQGAQSSGPTITNEGMMQLVTTGTTIYRAQFFTGCKGYDIDTQYGYNETYDDKQNVTTLEDRNWYERGKGYYKNIIRIEYQDGRMTKVSENELMGEGKSRTSVTVTGEDFRDITTLTWKNDHEVTLATTNYNRREKKKEPQKINFTRRYKILIEKNHYLRKTLSPQAIEVQEFRLSGKEASFIRTDSANKTKTVVVSTIDDSGKIVREIKSEYKVEKLDQKTDATIKSELNDPKADPALPCSYKQTRFFSVSNGDGVVTREMNENGIRQKNPDGTWGPWKGLTY